MKKFLLLLVAAACYAGAIADCANTLYVRFDQDIYLSPGYGWDIQGGAIRVNSLSPAYAQVFDGQGKAVFVLTRLDYTTLPANTSVGDVYVKTQGSISESSANKSTDKTVAYNCTTANKDELSFDYPVTKSFEFDGRNVTADFVRVSSQRDDSFGFDGVYLAKEFYVLAATYALPAGKSLTAGGVFFESPSGWKKEAINLTFLGCCEQSCAPVSGGCESPVIKAGTSCEGDWLYTHSCAGNVCLPSAQKCLGGCENNRCLIESSCTDSDAGINAEIKGTVRATGESFNGTLEETDFCESATKLVEWYCDGVFPKSRKADCEYGCADGACLAAASPTPAQVTVQPSVELPKPEEQKQDYGFYAALVAMALILGGIVYWLNKRGSGGKRK